MATKSPVFPMPEPHHFSDYGFDPQIDYFQVLEEAKRFKQRSESSSSSTRSIDTFHFKLQKPITKDDPFPLSKKKKKRNSAAAAAAAFFTTKNRRWWKTALFFFKSRWAHPSSSSSAPSAPKPRPTSLSGPIYTTESLSGPSTPFRAYSGPLSSTRMMSQQDFPYFNLRELNMDHPHRISAPSPLPIYLVT